MASRVALDSIRSLTFYGETLTQSRRTPPIPQLTCIGKPCNLFQPDVVRCVNEGGRGTDVDWKVRLSFYCQYSEADADWRISVQCQAGMCRHTHLVSTLLDSRVLDLPESLRFGRVEVSCEGWSRPGDPMILKGISHVVA
jgi:store-operated calcium entry-associated regulatory factor